MLLRKCGTNCPCGKAGDPMRGGASRRLALATATSERRSGARLCLATVGLLLMCTLMVGAVSADASINDITGPDGGVVLETDGKAVYNLTIPGIYTLTTNVVGDASNESVILISADNVILNGAGHSIDGSTEAVSGIRVADGYTNPEIHHITVSNVKKIGIAVGDYTNTYQFQQNGPVNIHDVTIGGTITQSGSYRAFGVLVCNGIDGENYPVTIQNVDVTAALTGESVFAIYVKNYGAVSVTNCDLLLQSSLNGNGSWGQGITAWSYNGDAVIANCNVASTISANILNAYGILAAVDDNGVNASITNCAVTSDIYGKSYAYALSSQAYGAGNATVSDCLVTGSVTAGVPSSGVIGIINWSPTTDDRSLTVSNTQVTSPNSDVTAVRIVHTKEDGGGDDQKAKSGLTINLVNNSFVGSQMPAGLNFAQDANVPVTLNIQKNTLTLLTKAFSFPALGSYNGIVSGNTITVASSGVYVATSGAAITDVNWVDLTSGFTVPNVITWTGDNAGWSVTLDKKNASGTTEASKTYQLTAPFSLKQLTVSANDVVIDGNKDAGVKVTLAASAEKSPIKISGNSVTLKNLDVTTPNAYQKADANGVVQFTGTTGKLQNSKLDFGGVTLTSGSFAAVRLNGADGEVSNSEIINGHATASSSQCIVVQGDNAVIQNNKLTTGKARETPKDDGKTSSGSVAVRVTGKTAKTISVTGNTITSIWSGTETTRNSGVSLDTSGATPVTVTLTGNTFTLNNQLRTTADNKALGGYGSVLYLNPGISTASVTIDMHNNVVKKGTYLIYGDGNDGATSLTVSGTLTGNDFGALTGKKYESSTDVTTFSTSGITETNNVEPAVPKDPVVTPTTDPATGKTTITPADGGTTTIEVTPGQNTATIKTDSDTAVITLSFSDTPQQSGSNGVIGTVSEVKAAYKPAPAAVSPALAGAGSVAYQLDIVLTGSDALGGLQLPTISPAHDETKARAVPSGYTVAAMITATNAAGTGINEKVQAGGVRLTFTVPAAWIDAIGEARVSGFHIGADNKATPVTTTILGRDGDTVKIQITGDGFSTYALAGYTSSEPPTSPPSSSSGNSENSFRVIFSTDGSNAGTVVAGLSYGDRVTKPADPTKDGYTFGGWYRNTAYTIPWDFAVDAVPGDTVLYAKWISGNAVVTPTATPTNAATVSATAKQTSPTAAPTGTAAATTAQSGGVSPTMTQAPAPVFGVLAGLLAAGVLLRRRA